MKTFNLLSYFLITLFVLSCSNPLDKPLGAEGLEAATNEITSDPNFSEMKKKYIVDELNTLVGFLEMGKAMTGKTVEDSFRGEVERLSSSYDSIREAKLEAKKNNERLDSFIELVDAEATIIDKHKGYLTLSVNFKNDFPKDVLYIVMNYKYINEYDTKYFEENIKVTDEVGGYFKGQVDLTTSEEYNSAAEFLYSKVPVRAPKAMRDELGEEVANKKRMSDFLLEGLQLKTTMVVFTDKSQIEYENADWGYLGN